eukprot:6650422-Pyramimonas_sp.AAC.1
MRHTRIYAHLRRTRNCRMRTCGALPRGPPKSALQARGPFVNQRAVPPHPRPHVAVFVAIDHGKGVPGLRKNQHRE